MTKEKLSDIMFKIVVVAVIILVIAYLKIGVVHDYINHHLEGFSNAMDELMYYLIDYKF